jgi:hypothetical protein
MERGALVHGSSLGCEEAFSGRLIEVIPLLKRAVESDPNFPSAYNLLSIAYGATGRLGLAAEYAQKTYSLRDRVGEYEKLRLAFRYHAGYGLRCRCYIRWRIWAWPARPHLRAIWRKAAKLTKISWRRGRQLILTCQSWSRQRERPASGGASWVQRADAGFRRC